jgi:hypothetical protein
MNEIYFSPKEENKYVEKLLVKLNAEYSTEQILVLIEDYSKPLNCFNNVDLKVKKDGGETHYGWIIYQTNILCEAERHAVWENTKGELIDVTPREIEFKQVMFLSDKNFIYEGQFTDNIRINITNNKLVDHFIEVCETLAKFYALGIRKNDNEINVHPKVGSIIQEYIQLKISMESYINSGATLRTKCLCGGLKNYKNCHNLIMIKKMNEDYERIKIEIKKNDYYIQG